MTDTKLTAEIRQETIEYVHRILSSLPSQLRTGSAVAACFIVIHQMTKEAIAQSDIPVIDEKEILHPLRQSFAAVSRMIKKDIQAHNKGIMTNTGKAE